MQRFHVFNAPNLNIASPVHNACSLLAGRAVFQVKSSFTASPTGINKSNISNCHFLLPNLFRPPLAAISCLLDHYVRPMLLIKKFVVLKDGLKISHRLLPHSSWWEWLTGEPCQKAQLIYVSFPSRALWLKKICQRCVLLNCPHRFLSQAHDHWPVCTL